jgi:hypothetical protein
MKVRLTLKFAASIDDIDLSRNSVGDVLDLSDHNAELLIAEGWAELVVPIAPPWDGITERRVRSTDRRLGSGGEWSGSFPATVRAEASERRLTQRRVRIAKTRSSSRN